MDENNPKNDTRLGSANYSIRTSVSIAVADDDNTTFYQRSSENGGPYNNQASYLKNSKTGG